VIESGDRLIAVCRYERYPGTTDAEVAFIVADDHQHQGLGQLMLQHLADAAWERGISTFLAETLTTNREMMSVFLASGYPISTTSDGQEITVRLSIEPTDDTRRERAARRLVGDPELPC
jgi:GNAT superfamily N-acetyltransferase